MGEIAIRVEGIGKKYHLAVGQRTRYRTIRETLVGSLQAPFRRAAGLLTRSARNGGRPEASAFWALKDVSFEVRRGEVVGVIGRNGAGKSTLLKILSRITEPTEGRAEIHGRVGSLLEVGTGFHPELTGRENIYLNGAILGMRRAEIERKFDEIVDFAEIEQFLDTPVKHYSSGMYVRLAFAVAAHLEPEILLVDEVLAVGDAAFQRKCLGKMGSVAREGRTILFVSHNMGAVENLCTSGLWLDGGRIVARGNVGETIQAYLRSTSANGAGGIQRREPQASTGARVTEVRLLDGAGARCDTFRMGETIAVEFDVEFERAFSGLLVAMLIKRLDLGIFVLETTNADADLEVAQPGPGCRRFRIELPDCTLYPASYALTIGLWTEQHMQLDFVPDVVTFAMVQSSVTRRTAPLKRGVYLAPSRWQVV